jgi:hypothetical protein
MQVVAVMKQLGYSIQRDDYKVHSELAATAISFMDFLDN